jgi:hypothetical protein
MVEPYSYTDTAGNKTISTINPQSGTLTYTTYDKTGREIKTEYITKGKKGRSTLTRIEKRKEEKRTQEPTIDNRSESINKISSSTIPELNILQANVNEQFSKTSPYKPGTIISRPSYIASKGLQPANWIRIESVTKKEEPTISEEKNVFKRGLSGVQELRLNAANTVRMLEEKYKGRAAPPKDLLNLYSAAGTSYGLGVIQAIGTPIIYPKETAISLFEQVKSPVKTIKSMQTSYQSDEAGFLGELYGSSVLLKAGTGGASLVEKEV